MTTLFAESLFPTQKEFVTRSWKRQRTASLLSNYFAFVTQTLLDQALEASTATRFAYNQN